MRGSNKFVTQRKAEEVKAEVSARYPGYSTQDLFVRYADSLGHTWVSNGVPVLYWEGGPEDFAVGFRTSVPGVQVEPVTSYAIAMFRND